MHEVALRRLEQGFDDIGITHERIHASKLSGAIAAATIEPAVATSLDGFELSLESSGITVDPTPVELWNAHTGITEAAFAISDYGSLYLPHDGNGAEFFTLFVKHHIVLLRSDAIIDELEDAFKLISDRILRTAESGIIATGPSATADMGELVLGAHGPKSVHVIIVMED